MKFLRCFTSRDKGFLLYALTLLPDVKTQLQDPHIACCTRTSWAVSTGSVSVPRLDPGCFPDFGFGFTSARMTDANMSKLRDTGNRVDFIDTGIVHSEGIELDPLYSFEPSPSAPGLNISAIIHDLRPRLSSNVLSYSSFGETLSVKWR